MVRKFKLERNELEEHLQSIKTCNPKNSNTMCKEKIEKKIQKPLSILCFTPYKHMNNS